MNVIWTSESLIDLDRLRAFLMPVAPDAAQKITQSLIHAPDRLSAFPRIGSRLTGFEPQEVRRIIIGNYEMRYQIIGDQIFIVRIFHTRENRPIEG